MSESVYRCLLFEAAVEIAAIKRRRRKIPLFPLDHNCTDALYQQSMEKSSTSLTGLHGAKLSFRQNSKSHQNPTGIQQTVDGKF